MRPDSRFARATPDATPRLASRRARPRPRPNRETSSEGDGPAVMSFMDAREHGSKIGGGGVASASQGAVDRRERLRRLALETIDLAKDPYFMRNHLGSYECKLCLTMHANEGNYLAHTQGKRHQQNLAKRAARDAKDADASFRKSKTATIQPRKTMKIGRPGYRVTKQYDRRTRQRSLLFQVDYPERELGTKPRYRFMSAYEQKVEAWDKRYQYVLFACEPYETIGFKIPNVDVDKAGQDKFFTHWDEDVKTYTCQLTFRRVDGDGAPRGGGMPRGGIPPPPMVGGLPPPPPPPVR